MIPSETIERIKDALPASVVIGRRVKLRRSGQSWKGLCPFHQEKTPSFAVNDRHGAWKCFGCGEGGDIIEFERRSYGLTFQEAVERLAADAGVALPKSSPEEIKREARRLSLIEILGEAQLWFVDQLAKSDEARAYLKSRGVTDAQARDVGIGYAPQSGLKTFLSGRCSTDILFRSGLVIGDGSSLACDRFRSRLVFPIRDIRGRIVSFGGRSSDPPESPST